MSELFMGFDVSLTCSGVAVIRGDDYETFNIKPPSSLGIGPRRLDYLHREFKKVIYINGIPDLACVEDYSFSSQGRQFNVGEGGGVFRLAMYQSHVPVRLVSPNGLKKFITGKGSGDKDVVMMKLLKHFDVEIAQNDQADAYGLAKMAQTIHAVENNLELPKYCGHKYQMEAIANTSVLLKGLPKRRHP